MPGTSEMIRSLGRVLPKTRHPAWRIVKCTMDFFGALCALLLLSPVFLVLIILVKSDGGPAFYGHCRVGKNGRVFQCWKFRTMAVDAEARLQALLERDDNARREWQRDFKLQNDPRITRIGHILRKTSLDEIPQFYNILRGEMSLVGPRPVVRDELARYGDRLSDYLSVRPGLTGLWQISGRNNLSYAERVELDSCYVRNWSLWDDILILLKTIPVVLLRRGAY